MSPFSICKLFSGAVLRGRILAHVWLAGLPNQVLGKVATFVARPAWLVTSLVIIVCGHRVPARGGNRKKAKHVATEIHLQRLTYSLPFSLVDLNLWPGTTALEYAFKTLIGFEKHQYCPRRAPRQYSLETEVSASPSEPFCPGSLM